MSKALSTRLTRFIAAGLLAVLLSGVAASCGEEGMYQGGGDSAPGWRK